ncbi:hypothetical protein WICPIJ_004787 [Wickerhamomyces pijperi]|uniref:Uncharacterized protein n=1 Tax=Wickerhamomyces pijperi TaxID=599730 RepID=A0A9P8TMJ8_WICPI|nr:hypothetical protein WICPIJ_004787 [Wickerhamomyces pijperi]
MPHDRSRTELNRRSSNCGVKGEILDSVILLIVSASDTSLVTVIVGGLISVATLSFDSIGKLESEYWRGFTWLVSTLDALVVKFPSFEGNMQSWCFFLSSSWSSSSSSSSSRTKSLAAELEEEVKEDDESNESETLFDRLATEVVEALVGDGNSERGGRFK